MTTTVVNPVPGTGIDLVDPRETMRRLPRTWQTPLTLFTGKPYEGERALNLSPTYHLVGAFASMATGLATGATGLALGGFWLLLLLPGWAVTLHGMRNLRMMMFHQCAHRNMYRRTRPDALLGQLTSSLLIIQNFPRYSAEHVSDHHAAAHMTLRDPTVQAMLLGLGCRPGDTRPQLWRRLRRKLFSPVFHLSFAVARVRSFLAGATRLEKVLVVGLHGSAVIGLTVAGVGWSYVVLWLVPLFPLYQVSNTLRLCVKHTFPSRNTVNRRGKEHFAGLTNAIFIGERAPDAGLSPWRRRAGWARWWLRMALVHLPARYLVLTGDTVVHDYHHRFPLSRVWFNYIYAREQDVRDGHPGWPAYREVWGLRPAIDLVFDSLTEADPAEFDVSRITSVSKRDLFNAFDD